MTSRPNAAARLALAIAAFTAPAACTPGNHERSAAVGYVDAPFTRSVTFGAVTIAPPAIGEHPLVSVTRAQYVALHPDTWLGDAPHDDLVAFGYGRVSAPTAHSKDGQTPFTNDRLAWVAVYRSSVAHVVFNGCLGGPAAHIGYHLVPAAPKPERFYIDVLLDATTGVQATATPLFRDTCQHLVRNR